MNVLWDLRLFSYGYGSRGVGTYTTAVASSLIARGRAPDYIWGDPKRVPPGLAGRHTRWIPYRGGSWIVDLFSIPALALRHGVDLWHYWVALGPIFRIGMGLWHPASSVATVHDLGVELWQGVPYLDHVRSTRYWAVQKLLARGVRRAVCNSAATARDLAHVVPALAQRARVVYPAVDGRAAAPDGHRSREEYFVALGGSPTKGLHTALTAFDLLRREGGRAEMIVLGEVEREEEIDGPVPDGVTFEPMDRYGEHLRRCAGLLYCSTHEGLGMPPLEAMRHGCPLLLSDIAALRETCEDAALFVAPSDSRACADGMHRLLRERSRWARASREGAKRYRDRAARSLQALDGYFTGGMIR
jgi:glycosyltransferase involved in cell wall biosynthesis